MYQGHPTEIFINICSISIFSWLSNRTKYKEMIFHLLNLTWLATFEKLVFYRSSTDQLAMAILYYQNVFLPFSFLFIISLGKYQRVKIKLITPKLSISIIKYHIFFPSCNLAPGWGEGKGGRWVVIENHVLSWSKPLLAVDLKRNKLL